MVTFFILYVDDILLMGNDVRVIVISKDLVVHSIPNERSKWATIYS